MRLNNYYNKKISLDELDYITIENISSNSINITSDKMYKEVHDFNDHMLEMQKKREVYVHDFWVGFFFNVVALIAVILFTYAFDSFDFIHGEKLSLVYATTRSVLVCLIGVVLGYAMYFYFIFYKKLFYLKLSTALMIFTALFNFVNLVPLVINLILIKILRNSHNAIKGDAGYPYFIPLTMTFLAYEEENKKIKPINDYRFSDYKVSPDTEMGIPSID